MQYIELIFKSQSLVNEGRFPQVKGGKPCGFQEKLWSQSLVNEGRFPLYTEKVLSLEEVARVAIPR